MLVENRRANRQSSCPSEYTNLCDCSHGNRLARRQLAFIVVKDADIYACLVFPPPKGP